MDPVMRAWVHCGIAAVILVVGLVIGSRTSHSQAEDPDLIFGTEAGIGLL